MKKASKKASKKVVKKKAIKHSDKLKAKAQVKQEVAAEVKHNVNWGAKPCKVKRAKDLPVGQKGVKQLQKRQKNSWEVGAKKRTAKEVLADFNKKEKPILGATARDVLQIEAERNPIHPVSAKIHKKRKVMQTAIEEYRASIPFKAWNDYQQPISQPILIQDESKQGPRGFDSLAPKCMDGLNLSNPQAVQNARYKELGQTIMKNLAQIKKDQPQLSQLIVDGKQTKVSQIPTIPLSNKRAALLGAKMDSTACNESAQCFEIGAGAVDPAPSFHEYGFNVEVNKQESKPVVDTAFPSSSLATEQFQRKSFNIFIIGTDNRPASQADVDDFEAQLKHAKASKLNIVTHDAVQSIHVHNGMWHQYAFLLGSAARPITSEQIAAFSAKVAQSIKTGQAIVVAHEVSVLSI